MPTQQTVRRSDKDILQFITDLPGANVPQYAKLLNTTAIRISGLLYDGKGAKLVKAGMVTAAEKGQMPGWATKKTARGCLRSTDVDKMFRDGLLPPFIKKLIAKVGERYQDDSLNFLRLTLDQTANHMSFETQMTDMMDQDRHHVEALIASNDRVLRLEDEMKRVDLLLEKHRDLAEVMENRLLTVDNPFNDAPGEPAVAAGAETVASVSESQTEDAA